MRSGFLFAIPLCLFTGLASAHADTIATFSLQGASIFYGMANDYNTVTGTATINTTTGVVQSVLLNAAGQSLSGVDSQSGAEVFLGAANAGLSFSESSLIGYTGSKFNLNGANDLFVGGVTQIAQSTELAATALPTAVAITPEPASLILLSIGSLAGAAIIRRRLTPAVS